jgi:large subunit ribosomal protein L19
MSAPDAIVDKIEKSFLREKPLPTFRAGDTVKVWVKIREGEKTRLQAFQGVCIKKSHGGSRESFTVRKVSYGVGVERVFSVNSPNIERVEVLARGRVRQARLYYLRSRSGKAARIKERAFEKGKKKQRRSAPSAQVADRTDEASGAEERE